jgi:hypothetical protein
MTFEIDEQLVDTMKMDIREATLKMLRLRPCSVEEVTADRRTATLRMT